MLPRKMGHEGSCDRKKREDDVFGEVGDRKTKKGQKNAPRRGTRPERPGRQLQRSIREKKGGGWPLFVGGSASSMNSKKVKRRSSFSGEGESAF